MLQIRKIRPEDIQFVMELTAENNCREGKLLSNIEGFLICENGNTRCGCGCLVTSGSTGYINWVMVDKSYRRQKLGGAITKALLNIADINGIEKVYAIGGCREFLSAMGFEECDACEASDKIKEIFGVESSSCFHVMLEGYFKPCSSKQ